MRWQTAAAVLVGGLVMHGAFVACSGMMGSGGDGGGRDGSGDALAQSQDSGTGGTVAMQGNCTPRQTDAGQTFYFASFDVAGFDPRTSGEVHARACGLMCTNSVCGFAQPSLDGSSYDCIEASNIRMRTGRIDVFCGGEGDRGQTVRLWLR